MKNVRKVKDVVDATPGLPDVAAIIKAKFSNNVSTGGRCKAGIDDIMTMSGFEQAVRELSGKEGAGDFADYKKILLHAKQKKGTFWPWSRPAWLCPTRRCETTCSCWAAKTAPCHTS